MKVSGWRKVFGCLGLILGNSLLATGSPFYEKLQNDLVEWHAWSEGTRQAIAKADKPLVFTVSHELSPLSRAMSKETFRNAEIAKQVNEDFIAIAVDKNLFPELAAYLSAYVWSTKQIQGWPLTVFTTPDFRPIDGGGYYPPTDSWGGQGFASVVKAVSEKWKNDRSDLESQAADTLDGLEFLLGVSSEPSIEYSPEILSMAVENLSIQYDAVHGGFTLPPKPVTFGPLLLLDFAVEHARAESEQARPMKIQTLDAMLGGAVRDFVRGGLFSSSTEESWTLPDFRKSALVQAEAIGYLSEFNEYREVVEEIADGLIHDFKTESGYFSEVVEFADSGQVHTWAYDDLERLLNDDELAATSSYFGLKKGGNVSEDLDVTGEFKGRNILKTAVDGQRNRFIRSAIEKLRSFSRKKYKPRKESVSSVQTNAVVASALFKADRGKEASALVERMTNIFWNKNGKRLHAAVINGEAAQTEASAKGYALFVQCLLDAGERDLAMKIHGVFEQRFRSQTGLYWLTSEQSKMPVKCYGFIEDSSGSVNSIALDILNRLSRTSTISHQLPEEASYAPEQYPYLISSVSGR